MYRFRFHLNFITAVHMNVWRAFCDLVYYYFEVYYIPSLIFSFGLTTLLKKNSNCILRNKTAPLYCFSRNKIYICMNTFPRK